MFLVHKAPYNASNNKARKTEFEDLRQCERNDLDSRVTVSKSELKFGMPAPSFTSQQLFIFLRFTPIKIL